MVDCRRVLKWTYTYGYYIFGNQTDPAGPVPQDVLKHHQQFFEFNQVCPAPLRMQIGSCGKTRVQLHSPISACYWAVSSLPQLLMLMCVSLCNNETAPCPLELHVSKNNDPHHLPEGYGCHHSSNWQSHVLEYPTLVTGIHWVLALFLQRAVVSACEQGQAELYLEKLHGMAERELTEVLDRLKPNGHPEPTDGTAPHLAGPEFARFRETLIGLTDVTRTHFSKLVLVGHAQRTSSDWPVVA